MSGTRDQKRPNLDSVTTINADGSRYFLHPSDVNGKYTFWRRVVGILLIALYLALPWIPVNGYPALFLNIDAMRFYVFGMTFSAYDMWVMFFIISGLGFALYFITSLFGRIWCGWTCPYTVFIDTIYRRIERWIEGDAQARRKLDQQAWNAQKIYKRTLKWFLYLLIASIISHTFIAYFVSVPALWQMILSNPLEHWTNFAVVTLLTLVLAYCFGYFREQFCIVLCPYGRIQSALTDDDTLNVGYDYQRGEPRGKAKIQDVGDCIDCRRCVQVCPTGIDIRNGLQMECIGCAACIDACDTVMTKLKRPTGLIRYGSFNEFAGKPSRRIVRGRTLLYVIMGLLGLSVFGMFASIRFKPFDVKFPRQGSTPYTVNQQQQVVFNIYNLTVTNKRNQKVDYTISLEGAPEGISIASEPTSFSIEPLGQMNKSMVLSADLRSFKGECKFKFCVHGFNTKIEVPVTFLGPVPSIPEPDSAPAAGNAEKPTSATP